MIRIKRAYDPPSPQDGKRVLIDRLWPRGISKDQARLDEWRKELAPSDELRRWFAHDEDRFPEFRAHYRRELLRQRDSLAELVMAAERGRVTLVYAARNPEHCNATVLKELLEENLG
ncbi:MAG: DUF488 domain-containing protein [Thermoplasmata archaeon]